MLTSIQVGVVKKTKFVEIPQGVLALVVEGNKNRFERVNHNTAIISFHCLTIL